MRAWSNKPSWHLYPRRDVCRVFALNFVNSESLEPPSEFWLQRHGQSLRQRVPARLILEIRIPRLHDRDIVQVLLFRFAVAGDNDH